ncbi:unnamed protein product [Ectocarpus sp. CCAP 1310/34]|nr:unnamed protein product [Ectocarpus sp. CCAP 1310/34]
MYGPFSEVDQAAPLACRSNGWRYRGEREGETYRRQAVFGAGYRLRLPLHRVYPVPGHRWFNSHPFGGDPDLRDFQALAGTMLCRGLVHPRDADAWRVAIVDVEGGGLGQLVVSAVDETWRHGIPTSLVGLQVRAGVASEDQRFKQLNIASFGHRLVRHDPLTDFGITWKERDPGACLAVLVADSWRDCQVDLLARDRRIFGFRDVDPLTGNYSRNLYSIMLERDVGPGELSAWLSGEKRIPAVAVRHLEEWRKTTKAPVVVWSRASNGADVLGSKDQLTSLRPRALHVGVREGPVYRLVLDGPWKDRFSGAREWAVDPSLDVSVEHCVRTRRLFHRIAETLVRCADMTEAILASNQSAEDQQTTRKRRRGVDDMADSKKTWYAPPGTALDELMLHLHLGGVTCTGRLTSYSHWDSMSLPAHGIITRIWCGASMGGLDDASGTTYGPGDWQCDINGAHTAAIRNMGNLPAFTHMDEVQAFDGRDMENWTLYVARLDAGGDPDVCLNSDPLRILRPARTVQKSHIPGLVQGLLDRDLGEPLLQDWYAARRFKKGLLVRTSGLLQQRHAGRINAVIVTTSEDAIAVGGKVVPVLGEVNCIKSELRKNGSDGELGIEKLDSEDAYLCFEASREVQEEARHRYKFFFSDELKTPGTLKFEPALNNAPSLDRVFGGIEVNLALDDLPLAMRSIPCPRERELRVVPLWSGIGKSFGSMGAAHVAWRSVGNDEKGKCGRTSARQTQKVSKSGLVGTPTNSLCTSYTDLPPRWSVKTADHQLGEEAAYMSLHALSVVLAATHSNGVHVVGTYDTHQLQPVRDSSGTSTSVDNVGSLLYILDAGDNSAEAQLRALERFGGIEPTRHGQHLSDFHLVYTRYCARFHAFQHLARCNETGGWNALGQSAVVGAQYRALGKTGKVHKNHAFHIVRSSADSVVVQKILFDPSGSCTVHAVQGCTVEGKLVTHQARHRFSDVCWLYTAISRATGPSNVLVLDDVHRSVSDMTEQAGRSWANRKVSSCPRADVTAGRVDHGEGNQHKDALIQALVSSYGGRCNSCSVELVWAVNSERQPTLDRLDCALPHTPGNVDVRCLKCDRTRGSLGRGLTKKQTKVETVLTQKEEASSHSDENNRGIIHFAWNDK